MKIKILTTISLILLILNVYWAFFLIGAPKTSKPRSASYDPIHLRHVVIRLKDDAEAVSEDGEKVVYEAGYELEVKERNTDGSIVVFDYDYRYGLCGVKQRVMTMSEPECEDITEEVHLRIQEYDEVVRRKELMKELMWYLYPDSGGSYLMGLLGASITAFVDRLWFLACARNNKAIYFILFIITNILIFPIANFLWFSMMLPPLVR